MIIFRTTVILAVVAGSAEAWAQDRLILLRSHVQAPSPAQRKHLDELERNLTGARVLKGEALMDAVESKVSRPSRSSGRPAQELLKQVMSGRRQFVDGNFKQAVRSLEAARVDLLASEARLASNQDLRKSLYMALMMLGHCHLRMKEPGKARAMIEEVIRSFPEREPSRVSFAPELVQLFKKVRRQLRKQQRASLAINTRPAGCTVFVNGRFVGTSPVKARRLLPGAYRVYVQQSQHQGRVHAVIMEGKDRELAINLALDRALRTRPHLALQLADRKQQEEDEVSYAVSVARAVGASQVLIAGLRDAGCPVLWGTLVSVDTGQQVRTGAVSMEPAAPSPGTIRAFARFLLSGNNGGRTWKPRCPSKPLPVPRIKDKGPRTTWISAVKWVALGVAVAGLGAGIPLLVLDGEPTCDAVGADRCPGHYDTLELGIAATVAGGVAAAGTVVLFVLDARRQKKKTGAVGFKPLLLQQGAGLSATIRF